jgi:uncharacterized protein (DUF342 family)
MGEQEINKTYFRGDGRSVLFACTCEYYQVMKDKLNTSEEKIKQLESALLEADKGLAACNLEIFYMYQQLTDTWLKEGQEDDGSVYQAWIKARKTREKIKPILEGINNE